ncbi:MAG: tetratricopeptide repeat-containing protein [Luteolibacter sp.]
MSDPIQNQKTPRESWSTERSNYLSDPVLAHKLLKRINGEGEHLLALEVAEQILKDREFDDAVPVQQQMARALAILGSSAEALAILEAIPSGRTDEAETRGLLARVWKDLAVAAEDSEERERCFRESRRCYTEGYEAAALGGDADGAAYCGINAAASSVWVGEMDDAKKFAEAAEGFAKDDTSYYGVATRAEAALILGKDAEAEALYAEASGMSERDKRWGDIASTRNQCRSLCLKLHGRRDRMDGCFTSGAVAIVSGKALMKDEEVTDEMMADVKRRVSAWYEQNGVKHVFFGAVEGWGGVVVNILEELGAETHKVEATTWGTPEGVRLISDRMVAARGVQHAKHLGVSVKPLVVGKSLFATAAAQWIRDGRAPYVIYSDGSETDGVPDPDVPPNPVPFPMTLQSAGDREAVVALLHMHFPSASIPGKAVLDVLSERIIAANHPPVSIQGFGGDYLFVFGDLRHAAELAMVFSETLKGMEEVADALPSMCLHAGLVDMSVNPLLHSYAPSGETVNRAAEIAGDLLQGAIYATETFSALSALESIRGFRFEHSGTVEVAGKTDRLFRIHPTVQP